MTFLDRVLDLLVGEDENAADHRYALICRHCRSHNGLAPPGERGDDVGYLCGRCGGWNGPDPNKAKEKPHAKERPQIKEIEVMDEPTPLVETIAELATPKGDAKVEAMIAKTQVAEE
jgi:hypothetical protein